MRGADVTQEGLFIVKKTSDYVPADHPLIAIREIVNTALREMEETIDATQQVIRSHVIVKIEGIEQLLLRAACSTHHRIRPRKRQGSIPISGEFLY